MNSLLLPGPNLLPLLADISNNWRNYEYVFIADVEKMFRQILIHPDDRQFQCILWRKNPSDPISEFELNTLLYGYPPSPYQANRTIKQLGKDYSLQHTLGAEVLESETYVDDVLS